MKNATLSILILLVFSVCQAIALAPLKTIFELAPQSFQQTNEWTPEEMKVVEKYGLRTNDNRGIILVSEALNNDVETPDHQTDSIKEALVFFMTTGFKKDLIYVRVFDTSQLP